MRGSDRSGVAALKGRFDIADFAKSQYRLETDERGWGHCPFPENHNNGDKNPSLQIDEEHQRVRCWSQGCFGEKGADIIDLVRKMEAVSFQEAVNILKRESGTSANHPVKPVVTAQYDYTDEESKHLFQIQRREPGRKGRGKDFIFRAPKPDGGWIYKKAGVRLVPYRLPEFRDADTVVIVEGEKCVDALWELGIPATTNPFGAGKWKDEYGPYFEGIQVILWPDNDKTGRRHMETVARSLRDYASESTVVEPPKELPPKGDVADLIAKGATRETVERILAGADLWQESKVPVPQRFTLTDDGNAERLAHHHGGQILFCFEKGWMSWQGTHWELDRRGKVQQLAVDTVRAIPDEAHEIVDVEQVKHILNWARGSLNHARIKAMVASAQTKEPFPTVIEDFDRHPDELNLVNGTLDLRTGNLQEHRREDLITMVAPVSFDANAQCPTWRAFLDRVLLGDGELIRFAQKAVGYSLSGSTDEECLFILHGTGANGKSTFIETIAALLGDYALQTPTETLMARRPDAPTNDLARLRSARFVSAAETEENRGLAESKVKAMTGGDRVTARFLHREFFEFTPEFKVWVSCNHRPSVRGTDDAIWRRIRLIPFQAQIPPGEQDPTLKGPSGKLRAEHSGILTWAHKGYLMWKDEGLAAPQAVRDATQAYRSDMDVLGAFINECCIVGEAYNVRSGSLYETYKSWCEENGERPLTQKSLGMKLEERGFAKAKVRGNWERKGIGLLDETRP